MANKLISSEQLQLALNEFKKKYDIKVDAKQDTLTAGSNIVMSNGVINVSSGASTSGKVLTANGSGGATWESASGGGVYTVTIADIESLVGTVYTFTSAFKEIVESGEYVLKINGSLIDPNDTRDFYYYPCVSNDPDYHFGSYNADYGSSFFWLHFVEDNGDLTLDTSIDFGFLDIDIPDISINIGIATSDLNIFGLNGTFYQVKQFNLTDTTYLASVVFNYADSSSETVECNYSIVGSNIYLTNVE